MVSGKARYPESPGFRRGLFGAWRLEGEPSQVETHLGCVSDLPSLRGPWMALSFAPAHPFGPASAYARLARKASHRRSRHTLAVSPTCQACGGHGWRYLSRRRIPSGLLRLTRGSPGRRAIAGRDTPWLCLRPAKPAGAMDGAIFRAGASLRACFGLREARPEGEPSQVEAHLGCVSDLPSLRGPWMAPQA